MSAKTITFGAVILMAIAATLQAVDFPKPESLPSRAERADVLTMFDGTKVKTKDEWLKKRKPELRELFQHYMYGQWPEAPKDRVAVSLHRDEAAFGGLATLEEIEIRLDVYGAKNPTPIRLLVVKPHAQQASPCFVGISFVGNHALVKDPKIRLPDAWIKEKPSDANRGSVLDVWPFEAIVKRGYAIAVFYCGDIQPDRPNVNEGLRAVMPKGSDTGTVISWAWGASRALDYLITDKDIDAKKIAVVGHSRLGKAAIVAAAFDERFAMAIPHQAGCGGTGPSRHDDPKAESVARITKSFPYWFSGNFPYFGEHLDQLPFDQHCLVALCAPRPVLFTNAVEDLWANPHGQFEMLKAATPIYELLGVEGLQAKEFPKVGELIDSRLGYHIRNGKHSMKPEDWQTYMQYADKWLK